MKKKCLLIIICILCLWMTACEKYPAKSVDGTVWDKSWTMMGSSLGVEDPGHDMTLLENNVVLAGDDTYYAAWTTGDPVPYVNEQGKDVDLYPAQIYLLYFGCKDEATAGEAVQDWLQRESETFTVTSRETQSYNGVEYTIIHYTCDAEDNPYERGVSAFGVFENFAISAEITCTSSYTGDESAVLTDFLSGCHYSSPAK